MDMAKKAAAPKPEQTRPEVKPDLVVGSGGRLFKVGLPTPAVTYIISAPSQAEAVEGYKRLAGVIMSSQEFEVFEHIEAEPEAEADQG
jgi:hypothetical protein